MSTLPKTERLRAGDPVGPFLWVRELSENRLVLGPDHRVAIVLILTGLALLAITVARVVTTLPDAATEAANPGFFGQADVFAEMLAMFAMAVLMFGAQRVGPVFRVLGGESAELTRRRYWRRTWAVQSLQSVALVLREFQNCSALTLMVERDSRKPILIANLQAD